MADNKEDNAIENAASKQEGLQSAPNVASLSIPTIILALHEKAEKQANPSSKGAKIINSALDDTKGELKSAGEHIISVIPEKEDTQIEKKTAVELLKVYVQWFVGPDLASKINDSTVKSLLESPQNESKSFMAFDKFLLLEAEEDDPPPSFGDDSKKDDTDDGDYVPEFKGDEDNADDSNEDKKDNDKKKKDDTTDESKSSKVGYYVPYALKVETLPQTALKDAMKKFAKTFFDDVTIKADGLFGGGASFAVKDVKDKWNEVFGPINPDELRDNIEKEIKNKYPKTDHLEVAVQDQDTLLSDIGDQADASQKKKIRSSKYSLFIKVTEHDPKKPLLNTRVIADIVTGSIKGLFKKFKNKITKNDVVYIPNYRDEHADTKKLKKLYTSIPKTEQLKAEIDRAKTANMVYKSIEKQLDNIKRDNEYERCARAKACVKTWEKFKEELDKKKTNLDNTTNKDKIKDVFQPFFAAYKKAFDGNKMPELDESCFAISASELKKMILESVFGISFANEAEDSSPSFSNEGADGQKQTTLSQKRLDDIKGAFNFYAKKHWPGNSPNINVAAINDIKSIEHMSYYDNVNDVLATNFPYAIVFDFEHDLNNVSKQSDSEKLLNEHDNLVCKLIDKALVEMTFKHKAFPKISKSCCALIKESKPGDGTKLSNYIEKNKLTKKSALKPDVVDEIKHIIKQSPETTKDRINAYFANSSSSKKTSEKKTPEKNDSGESTQNEILANDISDASVQDFIQKHKDKENIQIDTFGDVVQLKLDGKPVNIFAVAFDTKSGEGVDQVDVKDIDAGNINAVDVKGKEDLYIVPMPNMNYKDKEYDTYT